MAPVSLTGTLEILLSTWQWTSLLPLIVIVAHTPIYTLFLTRKKKFNTDWWHTAAAIEKPKSLPCPRPLPFYRLQYAPLSPPHTHHLY
ncbi:hypothetical protein BDR03DRAFT_499863 [Suillus americanus]|nr:hypothetical protein BDR03DRAFT_499863 [Suillus americanus]